jgi:hypothetical protein
MCPNDRYGYGLHVKFDLKVDTCIEQPLLQNVGAIAYSLLRGSMNSLHPH